jgi:hypothetical protein
VRSGGSLHREARAAKKATVNACQHQAEAIGFHAAGLAGVLRHIFSGNRLAQNKEKKKFYL